MRQENCAFCASFIKIMKSQVLLIAMVAVRRTHVFTFQEVEKICRTLQSHVMLIWEGSRTAVVRINAHAQLSRQNENAQAAIMVSLVASRRPTVALSNKVGLCHERTLPENFWKKNFIHLQKKICCQRNGLFVRSKSGRPIFSYFMARARCCLRSTTLLFMSYDKK